jgi:hypothetical protein
MTPRLDELYRMTPFIRGDRNSVRSKEATFAHFVEVCGMLTVHDRYTYSPIRSSRFSCSVAFSDRRRPLGV